MWAAASQMRDPLLRITSSFADLPCVWNLLWIATIGSPLRTSSWHRHYLITTGIGCWRNMFLSSTKEWQKSNEELDEGDIVWVLKDFTPTGIWPLGKIVKAHRGSDGIARSFDIQTATGMVQRPAVTLSLLPQSSNAPEGHWNKFIKTHTHAHTHTHTHTDKNSMSEWKLFCFIVFTFSYQMLAFVARSVK